MPKVSGLEGIIAAETDVSLVDGINGYLVYRGYWAKELALNYSYEDAVYLLIYGCLPNREESERFASLLAANRELPAYVIDLIRGLPDDMDMMSVLRTAVSALGTSEYQWEPDDGQAIRAIGAIPSIVACRYHHVSKTDVVPSDPALGHVANYLYMLSGKNPSAAHVKALNAYFVLTMEHAMNASTFAARTIASTQSDLISAIAGAIGALKGPLHGGAPFEVIQMLNDIGAKENAGHWLRRKLEDGERIMGFGHRVYKTRDPRAEALREIVEQLTGDDPWLDFAVHVENTALTLLEQYKPGRRLYTNVEFYAAAVFRAVNLPDTLYTATFTASRVAGWSAHILEQAPVNRIFRPQSTYTGVMPAPV